MAWMKPTWKKSLAQPLTMIASDSGHPRIWRRCPSSARLTADNARVLGRYVRDLRIITIEDAVRKMTSLPAKTFRLRERGELKPGFVADLVIFDPAAVGDPSTYANDPHHYATGFSEVIVNGVPGDPKPPDSRAPGQADR
jgi:N-acyl-D-amino-acid deacylase